MNAIPKWVPGRAVDPTGRYHCPLCETQATGDEADTGWVHCPMLDGRMICLGSCIDYQKVARSEAFAHHPERILFESLATRQSRSVTVLRRTCLDHQLEVVDEKLREGREDSNALSALRAEIERRRGAELA
jgi:hypothetical protein